MSKYVKDLLTEQLKSELDGVTDALIVNLQGLDSNTNCQLRNRLRDQDLNILVIKNSLAHRALKGTPLEPAMSKLAGPSALIWGGEDIVTTAKEIVKISEEKEYEAFEVTGGAVEGDALTAEEVVKVSKGPSRQDMLANLMGQILGVGSRLSGQLKAPAAKVASQVKQIADGEAGAGGDPEAEVAEAAPETEAAPEPEASAEGDAPAEA